MTSSLAAIHIARKQLGLDEYTYRAKLAKITGKSSAKDLSEAERQKVLAVFRNEGFAAATKGRQSSRRTRLSGRYAGKLQALWIAGWNLGVFRNRDDAALLAFVKRQTALDAIQFLRFPDDARKAIEAIKAILAREGGVDWSVNASTPDCTRSAGFKIAWAQWEKLHEPNGLFWPMVRETASVPAGHYPTDQQWILVMNRLGERIRATRSEGLCK